MIFYITQFCFFFKNSLFFILSKNFNISLYQLKYVYIFILFFSYLYIFLCSVILFVYYHIIFHIAPLSLAFHTITLHSVMFFCPNCQHTFLSSRGPSIHCYTYNNDNSYTPLPSSSTTSQGYST